MTIEEIDEVLELCERYNAQTALGNDRDKIVALGRLCEKLLAVVKFYHERMNVVDRAACAFIEVMQKDLK